MFKPGDFVAFPGNKQKQLGLVLEITKSKVLSFMRARVLLNGKIGWIAIAYWEKINT